MKPSSAPGRALTTGTFADIGRLKVPSLRGVVMRPPYFHDDFAANLPAVVQFDDQRFDLSVNPGERIDRVPLLQAL